MVLGDGMHHQGMILPRKQRPSSFTPLDTAINASRQFVHPAHLQHSPSCIPTPDTNMESALFPCTYTTAFHHHPLSLSTPVTQQSTESRSHFSAWSTAFFGFTPSVLLRPCTLSRSFFTNGLTASLFSNTEEQR